MTMSTYLGKLKVIGIEEDQHVTTFVMHYAEMGEIRDVKLYRGLYDSATNKWKADAEQAEKYVKNLDEILGATPETVQNLEGKEFDVWDGDGFSSFWEPV